MANKPPLLNYRQKALINLLRAFGGRLSSVDFQKYLFLYTQEHERTPSFEFVPYRFGCFSFQSYADKRRLIEVGVLHDTDEWRLKEAVAQSSIDLGDDLHERFRKKYANITGDRLVQEVYRRYPYYAIHSEIAARLMTSAESRAIEAARPSASRACLFTIGYEGSSFEGYLNRLLKHNVKTLVDVRRNPLSRKYGFSKKTLSDTAGKLGIDYIHIPELGIDSEQRQDLNTPADYARLFDRYERNELKQNAAALERLRQIATTRKRVAITCFEADACMCHRGRVAKALSCLPDWSHPVKHI
jgi:uncharacterized protein (DUF488 family)